MLTATSFSVEPQRNCGFDYLDIYDGMTASDPKIGRYCNYYNPLDTVTGTGHVLLLQFHSDGSDRYGGFTINWKSV